MARFLILLCLFALPAASTAEDWPRWRGVRADGSWRGPEIAPDWPKEGLKTVWKQPVGGGYSGVTVADGRVYVQDRPAGEAQVERVVCFNAADGSPVFEHTYPAPYDDEKRGKLDYRSGPRAAPTVHDGKVFTLGAVGELCRLDAVTGKVVWRTDLITDLHGRLSIWGYSGSPFIYKDTVIVQPGGADGWHVVALDKHTGAVRWHSLSDQAGYATPILTEHLGKPLLILWTPSHIRGIDPDDGTPLWEIPYEVTYGVSIADPIVHNDLVIVCGYWEGSKAIRLGSSRTEVTIAWEDKRWLRGLMSQPLQRDGFAYLLDKGYGLTCFELATGEKKWDDMHQLTPRGRNPQASLVWLNDTDRSLALNAEGELVLTRLTPEGPTELARAKIIGPTWAHPAYVGNRIFARSDTELVCVELPVE